MFKETFDLYIAGIACVVMSVAFVAIVFYVMQPAPRSWSDCVADTSSTAVCSTSLTGEF